MKNIASFKDNVLIYMLYIFSFTLPLGQKLSTFIIIAWLILSIIFFQSKNLVLPKKTLFLPALYFVYVISLFYSENFNFKYFEQKASLLAFPLIFYLNSYRYKKRYLDKALFVFVIGNIIASVICYVFAFYNSLYIIDNVLVFKPQVDVDLNFLESSIKGGNYFYGIHFSVFHQTVYFAMYICIAISILLFKNLEILNKRLRLIFIVFLSLIVVQISSRAGIATLIIVFLFYGYKELNIRTFVITSVISFFITIPLLITFNPRVKNMVNNTLQKGISFHNEDNSSFSLRLMTWDGSIQIVKKHPIFGIGIGDAYNELKKEYKKKRYVTPYMKSLNSHNQYLQLMIECGVVALLLFIIQLYSIRKKKLNSLKLHKVSVVFLIVIIFNSFFESIFNHYSGISFYCFLFCLFTFYKQEEGFETEINR